MSNSDVNYGFLDGEALSSDYNTLEYLITQLIADVHTATLVQVVSCTNAGGLSPVGMVDVHPLVNQLDAQEKPVSHGTIHSIPYARLQGGANAIIIDPQKGDIGIAIFSERDISSVKANKAAANPGSSRRFAWQDGLYIGGVLNGTPSQYVEFSSSGIKISSPTAIEMDAPDIKLEAQTVEINATSTATVTTPTFTVNGNTVLNGPLSQGGGSNAGNATITGTLTADTDVVIAGKSVINHDHPGVQSGPDTTGPMEN